MIEVIFTVDYEMYGNGHGSLREVIYEPTEKLVSIFKNRNARFVVFVEAAELEAIKLFSADPAIEIVEQQIRELYETGFEIGLHIHPQWYNAYYSDGLWHLDFNEYNLCALSPERIDQIIGRAIQHLRRTLRNPDFIPLSFRAGNWLLQPSRIVTKSLAKQGVAVDSSVFKGGLQHNYALDYRRSIRNGYYWRFSEDVNTPDPQGAIIEIPTYTRMVPTWKMFTEKRMALQHRSSTGNRIQKDILSRFRDFLRISHPMKLDFSRLEAREIVAMLDIEVRKDRRDPGLYRPIVAIGHTKDLMDFRTTEIFLSYLRENGISITKFKEAYNRILASGGES